MNFKEEYAPTYSDTNNYNLDNQGLYSITLSTKDFLEELENDLRGRYYNSEKEKYEFSEEQRIMTDKGVRMFLSFLKTRYEKAAILANINVNERRKHTLGFAKSLLLWVLAHKKEFLTDYSMHNQVYDEAVAYYHLLLSRSVGARENTNVYGHEKLQRQIVQSQHEQNAWTSGLFGRKKKMSLSEGENNLWS